MNQKVLPKEMKNPRRTQLPHQLEQSSIRKVPLFKGLPVACLELLEKNSLLTDYTAGQIFFRPGEGGDVLFLLEKGSVQTFRTNGKKKIVIADLTPPSIFGEMGCLGRGVYHCTAQATLPSRIRTIPREKFSSLLKKHPVIAHRLLDLVSERFVKVLLDLDAASFRPLIPRLAGFLLKHSKADVVRDFSHNEIAQRLCVYRETATAALGELKRAGIIALRRKEICVLDRPRLERAARESR